MELTELVFEKVGDINSKHPYLCVYVKGDSGPFMEIAVTDSREIQMTIYPRVNSVILPGEKWNEISQRANKFLPRAIADEDASG